MADGSVARVLYVDPNRRFVRVRTETVRNQTVRIRDLDNKDPRGREAAKPAEG